MAEVTTVGIGQPDVHHERVWWAGRCSPEKIAARGGSLGAKSLFGKATDENAAQQANRTVGALSVTAEPEQVVCDAAGQVAAAAAQLDGQAVRPQQAERADRPGR